MRPTRADLERELDRLQSYGHEDPYDQEAIATILATDLGADLAEELQGLDDPAEMSEELAAAIRIAEMKRMHEQRDREVVE